MAKTFIADKETLDLVKTETDKIGDFSDSTQQTLFAAINSLKKVVQPLNQFKEAF